MWSHLITSVSAIESCLHINHFGQPRPEGILLSIASFFHTKVAAKVETVFNLKRRLFRTFQYVCRTAHISTSCIGTRDMTIQLFYENVVLFLQTFLSKI